MALVNRAQYGQLCRRSPAPTACAGPSCHSSSPGGRFGEQAGYPWATKILGEESPRHQLAVRLAWLRQQETPFLLFAVVLPIGLKHSKRLSQPLCRGRQTKSVALESDLGCTESSPESVLRRS